MLALGTALRESGAEVHENEIRDDIGVYLLQALGYDWRRFLQLGRKRSVHVLHRVDGPICLIRGGDREKDDLIFQINSEFAAATILQSYWSYQRILEAGYHPVQPVIIHNAVDGAIFNRMGRRPLERDRKIRLISTSWSGNARKGGPTYKWIEDHLDWSRFEYTFAGHASDTFERIRHIPPVPSRELAELLRQHDIYITASQKDPCSNALLEALACGLPALYLNDGGHPELVGHGGLPFEDTAEILAQLDQLADNYEIFQNLIVIPTLQDVTQKYLSLLREIAESR